jgi:hypothetical protein
LKRKIGKNVSLIYKLVIQVDGLGEASLIQWVKTLNLSAFENAGESNTARYGARTITAGVFGIFQQQNWQYVITF